MIRHALAPVLRPAAHSLGLPRMLAARSSGVALTFDDGPHPQGTPAVLECLAAAGARATFFMVGEQVTRRPGLAAEVAAAGHVVALHGYRHQLQLRLSSRTVDADLGRGQEVIAAATGSAPRLHRPPYGIYSPGGLGAVRRRDMEPLLWSRWGKDWRKFTSPERITRRVVRGIAPGDVILLHDADFYSSRNSHLRTARALEMILIELKRRELATVLPV